MTGETVARDEAHRTGVWHGAFHCLITYEREGRGYALFQRRSLSKKIAPGRYDVTAGGHYSAGESATDAGPRELREEIGLDVKFSDLFPIGRRVFVYCFTPGVKECEFQDVFLLPLSAQPTGITLEKEEVDGVIEMEVDAGIRLFAREVPYAECRLSKDGEKNDLVRVSANDFVTCLDNYYLKLLLLAKRYFNGERRILFI